MKKGSFIVVEGPDGIGKSTAIRGLSERIRREVGEAPVMVREPGGTPVGESIRRILKEVGSRSPSRDLLLFSSARAELVKKVIRPALDAGKTVLADRFYLSTYVYQGGRGGVPKEDIDSITRIATEGLIPDLTLVLQLQREEWLQRLARRVEAGESDAFEDLGVSEEMMGEYALWARDLPGTVLVSASGDQHEVADRLWRMCKKLLPAWENPEYTKRRTR